MRRGRPLLILRSIGQRSRSFKLEIGIFCPLKIVIFHMWVGDEERKTPIDFVVNSSKVKVV